MDIKKIVEVLQQLKQKYPSLTNDEILRICEIKLLCDIKARMNR